MQPASMVYMSIGIVCVIVMLWLNRKLFSTARTGLLEAFYWLTAFAGLGIGWYFNIQYITQYGPQAGWAHWTCLLFVNPASSSGGQDLLIANVLIFPVWAFVEARREKMPGGWLYFPLSALTSYAFGLAMFLALQQRHRARAAAAT